jgi:hypothetical protein
LRTDRATAFNAICKPIVSRIAAEAGPPPIVLLDILEEYNLDIEQAIIKADRGGALLFFGAGFSHGARTHCADLNYNIPTAKQFADPLRSKLNVQPNYTLPIISKSFEKQKGELSLIA